jgi:glycerol-3-phosphate acyltransferase PlsY
MILTPVSITFISITLAYLLGSIPFGYLLVRVFRKQDIRASGSGNIGATNVARSGAKGLGVATLLLDLGKGALAVILACVIARHSGVLAVFKAESAATNLFDFAMLAAVAAVVGHIFPVWLGFRGGKGVATALGVFLALRPMLALVLLGVFAVVFAVSRIVSLASILAAVAAPLIAVLLFHFTSRISVLGFTAIALLVVLKHYANIGRLLRGTESRFGAKPGKSPGSDSGQVAA